MDGLKHSNDYLKDFVIGILMLIVLVALICFYIYISEYDYNVRKQEAYEKYEVP